MLYEPEAFEALTDRAWDESRVRDAIPRIVADTERAFDPRELWPAQEWDAWDLPTPLKGLYAGAAGVVWALDVIRRRGLAETTLDLAAVARQALERWRQEPELSASTPMPAAAEAGLLLGETGILVVAWRLTRDDELLDALERRIAESRTSPANELMWGTPGNLLAARSMLDATGDQRWADLWRTTAESLWTQREPDGLWTQQLDGRSFRALGPVHGLVGNVRVLLQGKELLAERRRSQVVAETSAILERDAVVEDGLANWPAAADPARVELRLQWCHGAPGILAAADDLLNEELVIAGAELTWQAGPPRMEKGSSICHGTAGNGYAFLKALARTGDERWLERARRFAVHALEQIERRGHGRYSLWTGDLGVALFAADCLEERTAYPIVDGWE